MCIEEAGNGAGGEGGKLTRLIWREMEVQSTRGKLLISNWDGRSYLAASADSGRKIPENASQ